MVYVLGHRYSLYDCFHFFGFVHHLEEAQILFRVWIPLAGIVFWLCFASLRNEFKAISQSVFKLLREKALPLVVFLYKLKNLAQLKSARAQNSSAHDYTVLRLASVRLMLHTKENYRKQTTYAS